MTIAAVRTNRQSKFMDTVTLPIDLVNAVYLPLAVSVATGVPLAIYTGLVASKMLSFNAAKSTASLDFLHLTFELMHAQSLTGSKDALARLGIPALVSLISDDQHKTADQFNGINNALRKRYQDELNARVTTEEKNAERSGDPNFSEKRWREIIVTVIKAQKDADSAHILAIQNLVPDYAVIFQVPTFGRWTVPLREEIETMVRWS